MDRDTSLHEAHQVVTTQDRERPSVRRHGAQEPSGGGERPASAPPSRSSGLASGQRAHYPALRASMDISILLSCPLAGPRKTTPNEVAHYPQGSLLLRPRVVSSDVRCWKSHLCGSLPTWKGPVPTDHGVSLETREVGGCTPRLLGPDRVHPRGVWMFPWRMALP